MHNIFILEVQEHTDTWEQIKVFIMWKVVIIGWVAGWLDKGDHQ